MPQNSYANIILPLALANTYTYSIPNHLKKDIEIGKRVIIQFGKKKLYTGIIYELHDEKPLDYETKEIISILDEKPAVNKLQLILWEWIAEYYCCTIGEVFKAALPSGLKLESETNILLNPEFNNETKLNEEETIITNFLENNPVSTIQKINDLLGKKSVMNLINSLLEKQIILIEENIKTGYKPKFETYISLNKKYNPEEKLNNLLTRLNRAPAQQKLIISYLSEINVKNKVSEIKKEILLNKSGCKNQTLNELIKKSIFIISKKQIDRIIYDNGNLVKPKKLIDFQDIALQKIKTLFKEKKVTLLHGITSSGKTEIYIHLINEILKSGKQVLYLLPEIALTSQMINRLQAVFGEKVVVYHSKFSDNERIEVYNKINNKEALLTLGVRSSVFLPFNNLELIIVDEEHENTYKQFNPAPRYHARDTAIILGKIHNCNILLGSATPSIETYYNTKIKKYNLIEIKQRYQNIDLPEIIIANVTEAKYKKQMKADFTPILFNEITKALEKKEQVILFQNRRGFSPYLQCTNCGWIPYCNNCDVSLTYHKHLNRLVCHYCGFSYSLPKTCKSCGSSGIEIHGFGTQKIEDDVAMLFPAAKIIRMDLDSTRKKNAFETIISKFENREIDILIGTQMVTKGLDFDNVSLVGILNADNMLNFPDFRAYERSYQLMAQVSGRAGRKNKQGKVIIQTSNPNHKILKNIIQNDYNSMFLSQLSERKKFKYPPLFWLINITVKHKKPEILEKCVAIFNNKLKEYFNERILGPQAPVISKIQNWYLKNFLIKIEKTANIKIAKEFITNLSAYIKSKPNFSNIQIIVDVDPQ